MITSKLFKSAACTLALVVSLAASPAWAGQMAFAIDGKGAVGHGLAPDGKTARNFARSHCGQPGCKVISNTAAKCNVLYHSFTNGYWYGVGAGATMGEAMGHALNFCAQNAPASSCRLAYKFCQ